MTEQGIDIVAFLECLGPGRALACLLPGTLPLSTDDRRLLAQVALLPTDDRMLLAKFALEDLHASPAMKCEYATRLVLGLPGPLPPAAESIWAAFVSPLELPALLEHAIETTDSPYSEAIVLTALGAIRRHAPHTLASFLAAVDQPTLPLTDKRIFVYLEDAVKFNGGVVHIGRRTQPTTLVVCDGDEREFALASVIVALFLLVLDRTFSAFLYDGAMAAFPPAIGAALQAILDAVRAGEAPRQALPLP